MNKLPGDKVQRSNYLKYMRKRHDISGHITGSQNKREWSSSLIKHFHWRNSGKTTAEPVLVPQFSNFPRTGKRQKLPAQSGYVGQKKSNNDTLPVLKAKLKEQAKIIKQMEKKVAA